MGSSGARIVIMERWSVLRRGLVGLLQGTYAVVDDVEDPGLLRSSLASRPVDLIILGDERGLDLTATLRDLRELADDVSIVVLSDEVDVDALRKVLQAGAQAVLSKKVDDHALLDGIARVLVGDRVIDQRYLPLLFGADDLGQVVPAGSTLLTRRECDVLALLAQGFTNRQIAESLLVGEATVKTHLGRIYAKLDATGRHHAVGRALELGLLG
jgi:DNA-binding NarL/FixJ family response regulator